MARCFPLRRPFPLAWAPGGQPEPPPTRQSHRQLLPPSLAQIAGAGRRDSDSGGPIVLVAIRSAEASHW